MTEPNIPSGSIGPARKAGYFGGPNDEGLSSHPLHCKGLPDLLWVGEVVDRSVGATKAAHPAGIKPEQKLQSPSQ
jgi:hypothetical protein